MNKIVIIFISCLLLTGCSLIPKITFNKSDSVPQIINNSKVKESCRGETKFDEYGNIIYCENNYYNFALNYERKERNATVQEKLVNFFRNLSGNIFWLSIIILVFAPGGLGWLMGRIFNGVNKAFSQTIIAIKKFRQSSDAKEELDNLLRVEQDQKTKELIARERAKI